ncbi:MarR family winged helix-turn-helix transcriptional regulator [Streptomyces marincola]|uniref:MarR family winged helix-turn-helix transcriptional regulator n=1 Tax=Streptomyces marincola TaxID=2878388 RepID=UPI001CF33693|nr:MarR family transcriptional regulator [Streptomyces marincola]UCM87100.1 MarR family transcriptional regulator [Streptomyces marincola]
MAETRWLDSEEMAAWTAFLEASHRVFHSVEQQLKTEAGLSHPQYEILVRLASAGAAGLRMTELAEALVTSKSGLTYQVDRLEARGLVVRAAVCGDTRGITAHITEAGDTALREAAPGHVDHVRAVLIDRLDRHQLAVLAQALGDVNARLRQRGA